MCTGGLHCKALYTLFFQESWDGLSLTFNTGLNQTRKTKSLEIKHILNYRHNVLKLLEWTETLGKITKKLDLELSLKVFFHCGRGLLSNRALFDTHNCITWVTANNRLHKSAGEGDWGSFGRWNMTSGTSQSSAVESFIWRIPYCL